MGLKSAVLAPEEDLHSFTACLEGWRQTKIRYSEEAKLLLQLTLLSLTTALLLTLAINARETSFRHFLTLLVKRIPKQRPTGDARTTIT